MIQETGPLGTNPQSQWWHRIVNAISPYFTNPYPTWDKIESEMRDFLSPQLLITLKHYSECSNLKTERTISGTQYIVYRPNHGLAHGLRQAFLVGDIIDCFLKVGEEFFQTEKGKKLFRWVVGKVGLDKNFKRKVELLAAFQRTGRMTDTGDSGELFLVSKRYAQRDKKNFMDTAQGMFRDLFEDEGEIGSYSKALIIYPLGIWDLKTTTEDERNLARILMTSHYNDLRRQVGRNKGQLREVIKGYLFDMRTEEDDTEKGEDKIVDALWARSGRYLDVTGESYIDDVEKRQTYTDQFYKLCNDPQKLIEVLETVKEDHLL